MNSPNCSYHQDRKAELLCLNLGCDNRLTLMCTVCLHQSRCKRHNWKIISAFIEQILQSAQNQQVKSEKRVNSTDKIVSQQISKMSNNLRSQLTDLINQAVNRFNEKGKQVLQKIISQKKHSLIKNIIKQFKKSEIRDTKTLNNILQKVDSHIIDDQEGVIHVDQKNQVNNTAFVQAQLISLSQFMNSILETFTQNIDNKKIANQQSEINFQIKKYQQQLKQIPILRSRIQSLTQKLRLKESKLKFYQEKSNGQVPDNKISEQITELRNKIQRQRIEKLKRTQTVLSLKETLTKTVYQHTMNCVNDSVKIYKLNKKQRNIDTTNPFCQYGALLNFAMMNLVDQLLFLGIKQSEYGQNSIEVPIIEKRKNTYRDPYYYN